MAQAAFLKIDGQWPIVRRDDVGIRPAGPRDACFYCGSKVGQPHGEKCVTVLQVVEYDVLIDNRPVGTWQREEPHNWNANQCEFHKNESSWCADSAIEDIDWTDEQARQRCENMTESEEGCTCSILSFRVRGVADPGPMVLICGR